eukprot:CAMPEP_0173056548 /NCGR_PEP_ID=MMETSP1102-20130122/202_1 /TAXON_ID=49646 /ORGANISM="Geminigera sp., Strain Caron Lab Isolate" /LENGTH=58 /DNA_ID=CAMNT_0013921877 /DNA_START=195 /DNA_END=372 /DNA_ORIENTATION=+
MTDDNQSASPLPDTCFALFPFLLSAHCEYVAWSQVTIELAAPPQGLASWWASWVSALE